MLEALPTSVSTERQEGDGTSPTSDPGSAEAGANAAEYPEVVGEEGAQSTGGNTSNHVCDVPALAGADAPALPVTSAEASLLSAASPVEDFFVETGAASVPSNAKKAPVARGTSGANMGPGNPGGMQKMLQEAFPVDKMQGSMQASLGTAQGYMSWGFSKIVEGATKVSDTVAEVDFAQEAQNLVQKTDDVMQVGVEEVSKLTEVATNQARVLGQDLETRAATLRPGLEKTAQAAELANKKASEFAEQMQPKILEAHEKAKKGLFKAASTAAATAIWFQSLASAGVESNDEASTGKPAEDIAKTAMRPQSEQTSSASQQWTEIAEAGPIGFQFHPEPRQIMATGSTAPSNLEESETGGESAKSIAASTTMTGTDRMDSASVAKPPATDRFFEESAQQENATLETGTTQDATSEPAEKAEASVEGPNVWPQEAREYTMNDEEDAAILD